MLIMICNLKYNWGLPAQDKKKKKKKKRDGGFTVNDTNAGFLRCYSLNFLKQERKKNKSLGASSSLSKVQNTRPKRRIKNREFET